MSGCGKGIGGVNNLREHWGGLFDCVLCLFPLGWGCVYTYTFGYCEAFPVP